MAFVIRCPIESQLNCINNDEIVDDQKQRDKCLEGDNTRDQEKSDKQLDDDEWLSKIELDYLSANQVRNVYQ